MSYVRRRIYDIEMGWCSYLDIAEIVALYGSVQNGEVGPRMAVNSGLQGESQAFAHAVVATAGGLEHLLSLSQMA